MPCYDKKLEAVRPKINIGGQQIAEIDTVLATHELFELFEVRKIDFSGEGGDTEMAVDEVSANRQGMQSGGYLEAIYRRFQH